MIPEYMVDVCERLSRLETLMENHLHSHEMWIIYFFLPLLAMVGYMFIKDLWLMHNSRKNKTNGQGKAL